MKFTTVCVLLLVLVTLCRAQDDILQYTCGPASCANGVTCTAGTCGCDATTQAGFDCSLIVGSTCTVNAALAADTACGCLLDADNAEHCSLCPVGFMSTPNAGTPVTDCSVKRLRGECGGTSMQAFVAFYSTFTADSRVWFIPDSTNLDGRCELPVRDAGGTSLADADGILTFDFSYDMSAGTGTYPSALCQTAATAATPLTGFIDQSAASTVTYRLLAQYGTTQTNFDEIIDFECTPTTDGTVVDGTVDLKTYAVNAQTEAETNQQYLVSSGGDLEITGALYQGDTTNLVDETVPLTIGTKVCFQVYKTIAGTSFPYFAVQKVMAQSDNTATPAESEPLVENSCLVRGLVTPYDVATLDTVGHPTTSVASSNVKICFDAFKFQSSDFVFLDVEYLMCTTEATCNPGACDGTALATDVTDAGATGKRRKRRAVGEFTDGSVGHMNFTIRMYDYTGRSNNVNIDGGTNNNLASCVQQVVFIVPLILLVVLVVISMAIAVYFFTRLNRRNHKEDGMTNMAYKS